MLIRRYRPDVPRYLHVMRDSANALTVTGIIICLLSCSGARVKQFQDFAQAGIAYSKAADAVLSEAGNSVIDESSDTLTLTRNQLTEVERKDEILRKNNSDREFLIILSDIRRHTFLLRDYFATLNSLAESGAPVEIGKSADALYGSLAALYPKIESANINGWPVKNFISPVTTLAVAKFQQAALEKELKARATSIDKELALQQAAMKAVSEGMRARLEAMLNSQESTSVVLPYVDEGKPPKNQLPINWAKRRQEVLVANVSVASVTAAADAAEKLKLSFEKLVRGELSPADLDLLLQDLHQVSSVLDMFKQTNKAGK